MVLVFLIKKSLRQRREQESRVRVCKWRPKSACVLLRDHTLYGLLPPILWSKNSRTYAGAVICDGNQDKWYKQRGIHGSWKASAPNKSYKGTGMNKEAVRVKWWGAAMWNVKSLDRDGTRLQIPLSSLWSYFWFCANMLVCNFFSTGFFISPVLHRSANLKLQIPIFKLKEKACFSVKCLTLDLGKLTFMQVCWSL